MIQGFTLQLNMYHMIILKSLNHRLSDFTVLLLTGRVTDRKTDITIYLTQLCACKGEAIVNHVQNMLVVWLIRCSYSQIYCGMCMCYIFVTVYGQWLSRCKSPPSPEFCFHFQCTKVAYIRNSYMSKRLLQYQQGVSCEGDKGTMNSYIA